MAVWEGRVCILRFKDDSSLTKSDKNLQFITLPVMMKHFYKWTTGWSCNFTEVQIDFIKNNTSLLEIEKGVQDMDDEESDYENEASSSRKISEKLCECL